MQLTADLGQNQLGRSRKKSLFTTELAGNTENTLFY